MTCKNPYNCNFNYKICIYSDLEHFKKIYNEVINELTKYKSQHRLERNYYKTCPICKKVFYDKRLNVKFCSDDCREKGYKKIRKKCSKDWYEKNKEHLLEYQRTQYRLKHPK